MFNFLEKTYEGILDPALTSPRSSVIQVVSPVAGTLREVTVYIQSSTGTSIWNVRAAGVALWAGGTRPTIISAAKTFTKSSLTTVVAAGDVLQLDLEDAGGSVSQPVTVIFVVDDNVYGGNSVTSNTIGTGSKTFTTLKGLFYSVGTRVRVARTAAPTTTYMEGVVTAYLGDQLTLTSDLAVGSGTYTDWTLSLAGERGATGATGATGAAGTNGTNGQGVPTGGTTEQILSKIDGTNYNTHWIDKTSGQPVEIGVAVSDETTAITTGTAKLTFYIQQAFTLTAVWAGLSAQSTSGLPTVNIKKNGTTIFSTKITIDANEDTSLTAATPYVLSVATSFARGDKVTIDIDVAGTGAKGLKVFFEGTR